MQNEVKTAAATSGPDGSREITLDPIATHTLTVEARRVESTLGCGFRVPWLSGSSGEGVERHDAVEFEVDCGAGVGSRWLMLDVKMPDGSHRAEVIDIGPLVQTWVNRVVADGPTGPWWLGQYPEGREVDVWDNGWWPGKVWHSGEKGLQVEPEREDSPEAMWVFGPDEIAKRVRQRG